MLCRVGQQVVFPYDPDWPRRFETERARLEEVLAPWLVAGVHHIGSTAVPGLTAKPVIDMMAGIRDLNEARAAFEPLQALGYEYREHRPEAHLFWTPTHGRPLDGTGQRPVARAACVPRRSPREPGTSCGVRGVEATPRRDGSGPRSRSLQRPQQETICRTRVGRSRDRPQARLD